MSLTWIVFLSTMTTFLNKDTHLVDGDIGAKIIDTDTVFLPPRPPWWNCVWNNATER